MSNRTASLLLLLEVFFLHVLYASATGRTGAFDYFVRTHGRSYQKGTAEYDKRHSLFNSRLKLINEQNNLPGATWKAGVNRFTDWTEEELKSTQGDRSTILSTSETVGMQVKIGFLQRSAKALLKEDGLPPHVAWTNLSVSNIIRDQGACGSCWALSTATALDHHSEIHMGSQARSFSHKEIVQCAPNPHACGGTGGCEGATSALAMHYIMAKGLRYGRDDNMDGKCSGDVPSPEMSVATTAGLRLSSHTKPSPAVSFGLMGWRRLPINQGQEELMHALAKLGPVMMSLSIGDGETKLYNYMGGIFDGCLKSTVIGHSVLAIGYGTENGADYWLAKNSWGHSWGENGNFRLKKFKQQGEWCGTDNDPKAGSGCADDPHGGDPIDICGMCGMLYNLVVPIFKGADVDESNAIFVSGAS